MVVHAMYTGLHLAGGKYKNMGKSLAKSQIKQCWGMQYPGLKNGSGVGLA
jgi:hypothetical protein